MSFLSNNTQGFVVGLFTLVIAGAMMAYVFLRKKKEEVAMITPALLTSSSLTESTSSQPDGERKEESDLYEGKYHEQTTDYESKYQQADAKKNALQWRIPQLRQILKKWSCQQLFFVL